MAERAVINASPLIFLSRSHHLDLLQCIAQTIWVPEPVADEIMQRGTQDVTARALEETPWLVIRTVADTPTSILEWRLGSGESATLALAHAQGLEAIIDDLAGRKCAASLGIPVRGTLGTVRSPRNEVRSPKPGPSSRT